MLNRSRRAPFAGALIAVAVLAGCASPDAASRSSSEIYDPYEGTNRAVHSFNLGIDRIFFRPASNGYTNLIPDPIEDSFNSFSRNLSEPGDTANFLAQGNFRDAGRSLLRFLINSTIGFAGLADPATEFGIPETETDFGVTLHTWGFAEGPYIELPIFGPSNARDAVGTLADFFTNPITFAVQNPFENAGVYAGFLERLSDRGRFSDTVDSILYGSADSYAQARIIYLQNRRFELAETGTETYLDPYEDTFEDPYEDPYAE